MADPTSAPLLVPPHLIMPPYNSATATASASAARRSASPSFPAPPGAQSKSSGGYNTPAGPYVDGYHAGPASGNLSSTGSVSGGPSAGTAAASSGFPDPAMLAALAGFSAAVRANSPKAAPLPGGTPSGSGNANGGGGSGGNSGRVSPMGGSLLLGGLSRALGSPGSSMGPTLTGSNGGAQASIGSAAVDASGSAGGGTSQMGMAAGGMAAAAGAGVYPPFAGYAGYTSGYNSQGLGQLLYRHTPAAERQGAAPPDYLHRTPSHSRALHAPKPQGGHAVPGLLQAVDNSSQPAVLPVYGFGGGDEGTGPLEGAFGSYVCSGIPSALNVAPGSAAASSGDRGSDDTEMQDVGMAAGASESAGAAGTARPTPMPSAPSPPFSPTARNAQSGRMSPAGSAGAGGGAGGLQCVGSRGSSPGLPAAPLPPAVCLATAQRFIATVLRGVREGLSLEVEEEIQVRAVTV